ncbi:MAG: hypothetical protein ACRYFS_02155 [Janthinobacterium lividum]
MRRLIYALLLLLILPNFVLAESISQTGKSVSESKKNPGKILTVTDIDSTVVVSPNSGSWNFGNVDPMIYDDGTGYSVSHEFTLINNNKNSVVVKAIQGSDFRVAFNLPISQQSLPVTVPADGLITIKLIYHLLPLEPGSVDGSAKVFIDDQIQPAATLQFIGVVKPVVTFDPPLLDFGTMISGQILSKTIKVTYDRHMFPGIMPLPPEKLPHVASNEPFIDIKQTAIGFTSRASLFKDVTTDDPGNSKAFDEYMKHNKYYIQRLKEELLQFETLPPLNNVVTCQVTVTAPAVPGKFRGFVVILPIEGTAGTEALEQENAVVQREVVLKK